MNDIPNIINNLTTMLFSLMYFGVGLLAAWFIWTDRKITKLSIPATLTWMFFCICMPLMIPLYIFYRQNNLL